MKISLSALIASVIFGAAHAWGSDGHQIAGLVAQAFLNDHSTSMVNQILDSTYNGQLGPAAPWADSVKHTKPYSWSAPLHFADTNDSPPHDCSFDVNRDCPNGICLTGAISNYTSRLDCHNSFSLAERDEALKFLVHYFGDITQPLHVCGRDLGGNKDSATFDGVTTTSYGSLNLHSVWDESIITKHVKNDFGNTIQNYADALVQRIKSGDLASQASSWIACSDPTSMKRSLYDRTITKRAQLKCPIEWATDTNGFDCTVVWPMYDQNPSQDLGGAYYTQAYPVVDVQLAKAGYRLGTWLNNIFSSCSDPNTPTSGSGQGSQSTISPPSPTSTSTASSYQSPSPYPSPSPSPYPSPSPSPSPDYGNSPSPKSVSCTRSGEQYCPYADGTSQYVYQCSARKWKLYTCSTGNCYTSGKYAECV